MANQTKAIFQGAILGGILCYSFFAAYSNHSKKKNKKNIQVRKK